jgi:hypothetical protein
MHPTTTTNSKQTNKQLRTTRFDALTGGGVGVQNERERKISKERECKGRKIEGKGRGMEKEVKRGMAGKVTTTRDFKSGEDKDEGGGV